MVSASSEMMPPQHRSLLLGGLLCLCLLLNANCVWNGFVYDDHSQIEQNPYVHSFVHIGKILGRATAAQQGKQAWANNYRPLVNLSFLISYKLFGLFPYGYHLVNLFLHLIVVGLVFVITSKLFSNDWMAILAAAIFALHPIHTEPVAWIDGISDPLFSVFYLFAFLFYLQLEQAPPESAVRLRVALLVSFCLGLLSKETAMTFPVLVTVYEHFYRSDRTVAHWSKKLSRYGWVWLLLAVYLVGRGKALGTLAPPPMHPNLTQHEILFSGLALIGQYAKALVWPVPLLAFAPFHPSSSFRDAYVMTGVVAFVASVVLFLVLWKNSRMHSFSLLWMALLLAPALNARWMAANVYAERYAYLPSLGFCWFVAGFCVWIWRRTETKVMVLRWVLAGILTALAVLACCEIVARNGEWKNDRTLIVATLKVCPNAPNMRSDLGLMDWYSGNHQEAERQWLLALSYKPDTVEVLANLGMARLDEKRYAEAITYLQKAIALKPFFAIPHIHLARVYLAEGKPADAEAEFRRAVDIYPANPVGRKALGQFYLDSDRLPEAEEQFLAAAEARADLEDWLALGQIYSHENRHAKALEAWQQALTFDPFNPLAHLSLGRIYSSTGRYSDAQKEFEACLLMEPSNQDALAGIAKLNERKLSRADHAGSTH